MPTFKVCFVCKLSLPVSVMRPIRVKHNGEIMVVGICEHCEKIKRQEAQVSKENPNANN